MHSVIEYDALLRDRALERVEHERAHVVAIRRRERAVARATARAARALLVLDRALHRSTDSTDAPASGARPQEPTADARSTEGRLALV